MGIKNLREKKKKERERLSKSKVLNRRMTLRKKTKEEKEAARLDRKHRNKITPYVNPVKKDAKIRAQLEHNAELIKQLEKNMKKTDENRKEINKKLEENGCFTMKEKLDALEKNREKELNINEQYAYEDLKAEKESNKTNN